uniref:RNA polymerase sigma factor n=1 Tax=Streptomyces sp. CA-136453 TaxID=3240050 RepID=UPI003F491277
MEWESSRREDVADAVEQLVLVMLESDDDRVVDNAYNRLYALTLPRLVPWFARRESNPHVREELLQELWYKALRALYAGRYVPRADGNFLSWLFRIATNVHADYVRRCQVRAGDHLTADMLMLDRACDDLGPEAAAEARQVAAAVAELVSRLPQGQQDVLKARFFEGLTTSEVAAKLGKKEGNIRTLQHRGLARLGQMIPTPSSGNPVVEYLLRVTAGEDAPRRCTGETDTLREKVEHARALG